MDTNKQFTVLEVVEKVAVIISCIVAIIGIPMAFSESNTSLNALVHEINADNNSHRADIISDNLSEIASYVTDLEEVQYNINHNIYRIEDLYTINKVYNSIQLKLDNNNIYADQLSNTIDYLCNDFREEYYAHNSTSLEDNESKPLPNTGDMPNLEELYLNYYNYELNILSDMMI